MYAYVYVVNHELVYACVPWAIESADARSNCFWELGQESREGVVAQCFLLREIGQVYLRIRANACRYKKRVCVCAPNLPIYTSYRPCKVFAKILISAIEIATF